MCIRDRWIAENGHQIGSHTYTHLKIQGSNQDTILQEINKTEVLLKSILGEGEYWLRPPYGLIDEQQKKLIKTPMVYWSVDPEDWKTLDTAQIVEHVCCLLYTSDAGDDRISVDLGGRRSYICLLYTTPSPRDLSTSRMPSSA